MIYHPNTLFKATDIKAMAIVIHDDTSESDSSDSDVNIEDLDELGKIIVHGSTFEMKSDTVSQAAINECVNNMFGTGTRLATWGLEMDKIVLSVHIYGIVAALPHPDKCILLKLTIDFMNGRCDFLICDKEYSF